MTTGYQSPQDLQLAPAFVRLAPTEAQAFLAFDRAVTISINAAATVASLPVEEQVAAVAGGKKELQQADRQVHETRSVARTEPESPEGVIARLKQTITELRTCLRSVWGRVGTQSG